MRSGAIRSRSRSVIVVIGALMLGTGAASQAPDQVDRAGALASGATAVGTQASAPAGPAGEKPAIDAAKQDFDRLKAVRDASGAERRALPRLAVPELHSGHPQDRPRASSKPLSQDERRGAGTNWLVDAMAEDRRVRGSSGTGERLRNTKQDRLRESQLEGLEPSEETGLASELSARSGEAERRPNASTTDRERLSAPNPLTGFLDEWLTARDYAVLKPALQSGADRDAAASSSIALDPKLFSLPQTQLSTGANPLLELDLRNPTRAANAAKLEGHRGQSAESNPYLDGLWAQSGPDNASSRSSTLAGSTPVGTLTPSAPVPAQASPQTPVQIDRPGARIPEFARPLEDEKYFKQLKRF
jgi:hypothetical protein